MKDCSSVSREIDGDFDTVGSRVPTRYSSYVRILHAASLLDERSVTWASVAAQTGQRLEASTRWRDLIGSNELLDGEMRWTGVDPFPGPPTGVELRNLGETLISISAGTDEPCCYGIWSGWSMLAQRDMAIGAHPSSELRAKLGQRLGALNPSAISDPKPLGDRYYRFGKARLGQVVCDTMGDELFQSLLWAPDVFWACDGSWFVHSDVELDSTLVGGSDRLCSAIVAQSDLEALPISVNEKVF